MIHAYAIEPEVAASWTDRRTFRFIIGQFGIGTTRAFLEIPRFKNWKRAVYAHAEGQGELEKARLAELFKALQSCRVYRGAQQYDGEMLWIENALIEYQRHPFTAILAMVNPDEHPAIIEADDIFDAKNDLWNKPRGLTPKRTAPDLRASIAEMLNNCKELHMIDPHFGPENRRHRLVLEHFLMEATRLKVELPSVTIHCSDKAERHFFETAAAQMCPNLPNQLVVQFRRWKKRDKGERFHNRYLLTNLGGVTFGGGMDEGQEGETDDINLMDLEQFERRWAQFVSNDGSFDLEDSPADIIGGATGAPRR